MTPIVEIAVARLTRSKAIDDEDARRRRRLQWLSTEKKMQLTISSSKTDLGQKVKLDKDNLCIFFSKFTAHRITYYTDIPIRIIKAENVSIFDGLFCPISILLVVFIILLLLFEPES